MQQPDHPIELTMQGRTCLITGGTGGIGLTTACELARRGARVIVVGRDQGRGDAALTRIRDAMPGAEAEFLPADLSRQDEILRLALTLNSRLNGLDVLLNNVGAMFPHRQFNADGFEMTFAVNHLSPFLLSHLLLDLLRAAGASRIVNVASEAHRGVSMDFANLQGERKYSGWRAYKVSKLANLLFTYEFARRLDGSGVTVNALHPGFVATDIGVREGLMPGWLWRLVCLAAIGPEEGARTSVHVASSPDLATVSGRYFVKSRLAAASPASLDAEVAKRLWETSAAMTRL
jgi:retinol dehydrogenase 12